MMTTKDTPPTIGVLDVKRYLACVCGEIWV